MHLVAPELAISQRKERGSQLFSLWRTRRFSADLPLWDSSRALRQDSLIHYKVTSQSLFCFNIVIISELPPLGGRLGRQMRGKATFALGLLTFAFQLRIVAYNFLGNEASKRVHGQILIFKRPIDGLT